jgi:hypothetical protein
MTTNQRQFYDIAGKEVMDCRFAPGPMARAFSESMGHKEQSIALYIKYRVEELQLAEAALDLAQRQKDEMQAEAEKQAVEHAIQNKKEQDAAEFWERSRCERSNITRCPNCRYHGKMRQPWFTLFSCACPKCNHRFHWYFHKMPAAPKP